MPLPDLRGAARTLLGDRVVVAGLVLVLVQVLWRSWVTFGTYFWQDDFRLIAIAVDGLTAAEALQRYNGHLMPGDFVAAWLLSGSGTDFTWAAVSLVLASTLCALLMLWLLTELFPGRRVALVGLAVYLFTPLGLVATTWWAFGVQTLPLQAALLGTAAAYVRFRRTSRTRWVLTGIALYLLGLFFYEKALLVPVLALGLALLVVDVERPWRERLDGLRRDLRFWGPLAAVTAVHLTVYLTGREGGEGGSSTGLDLLGYLRDAVVRTLVPGLLGGPWTADGALNTLLGSPTPVALAVSVALVGLLVAHTVRRRGVVAVQAWLLAVTYLVAVLLLVLALRTDVANFLARDPRYLLDAVPVLVVSALAALVPVASVAPSTPPVATTPVGSTVAGSTTGADLTAGTVGALVVAVLASSWVTTEATLPYLQHDYSRTYVATLADATRAEPGVSVVNAPAPPVDVVAGPVGELATAMRLSMTFDVASTDLRIVDGLGRLAPVTVLVADAEARGPEAGCGWVVTAGRAPVRLPLSVSGPGLRVLRLAYGTEEATTVVVEVDGEPATVAARRGLGHIDLVTRGAIDAVTVSVPTPGAELCVPEVTVGAPWPASEP